MMLVLQKHHAVKLYEVSSLKLFGFGAMELNVEVRCKSGSVQQGK